MNRLEIEAASISHNERKDCTVVAMALALDLDYKTVHSAMAIAGRKHGKACNFSVIGRKAAADLGFLMETLLDYSAKTMITAERDPKLAKGRYIIQIRRHVAALIDGKVIDWSQGRRKIINRIYTFTPMARAVAKAISIPAHDWLAIPVQTALNL